MTEPMTDDSSAARWRDGENSAPDQVPGASAEADTPADRVREVARPADGEPGPGGPDREQPDREEMSHEEPGSPLAGATESERGAGGHEGSIDEGGGSSPDAPSLEPAEDPALQVLRAERDEYLDGLRRVQADFENYRKRVLRQQADQADRAAEELVVKLLPVLDTVDLALAHLLGERPAADGSVGPGGAEAAAGEGVPPQAPWATESAGATSALRQVATALFEALGKEGLERIDPVGQPFDPTEHEAVVHEADGGGPNGPEVVEVLRSGWRWRGRVVRAALVKVKG